MKVTVKTDLEDFFSLREEEDIFQVSKSVSPTDLKVAAARQGILLKREPAGTQPKDRRTYRVVKSFQVGH